MCEDLNAKINLTLPHADSGVFSLGWASSFSSANPHVQFLQAFFFLGFGFSFLQFPEQFPPQPPVIYTI